MNDCVNVCVHGVLKWISVPFSVYFHLASSVTGIGSESTLALTKLKWVLKMYEGMLYLSFCEYSWMVTEILELTTLNKQDAELT